MFPCVLCCIATLWWPSHAWSHAFPVPGLQIGQLFARLFAYSLCLSTANCCLRAHIVPVPHTAALACLLTCLPCPCASTWQPGHACLYSCCIPVLCLAELLACLLCPCVPAWWSGHAGSHVCLVLAPPRSSLGSPICTHAVSPCHHTLACLYLSCLSQHYQRWPVNACVTTKPGLVSWHACRVPGLQSCGKGMSVAHLPHPCATTWQPEHACCVP